MRTIEHGNAERSNKTNTMARRNVTVTVTDRNGITRTETVDQLFLRDQEASIKDLRVRADAKSWWILNLDYGQFSDVLALAGEAAEHENQESMTAWFLAQTKGHQPSPLNAVKRIGEEYDEALQEVTDHAFVDTPRLADELADIVISALVAASMCGVSDLQEYIDAKMAVNRSRKWRMGSDFCIHHIKDGE